MVDEFMQPILAAPVHYGGKEYDLAAITRNTQEFMREHPIPVTNYFGGVIGRIKSIRHNGENIVADFDFDLSPNAKVSCEVHQDELIVGLRVLRNETCVFTGEVDNNLANPDNWKWRRMPEANEIFIAPTSMFDELPRKPRTDKMQMVWAEVELEPEPDQPVIRES